MLELSAGQVVQGFEVRRKIGQGGMGAVYVVFDPKLQVERALKVIAVSSSGMDEDDQKVASQRFFREARTLAKLRHANIIPVHVVGELEGHPFIVMTYFPSADLRSFITTNPSLDRVLHIGKQLASALEYAHGRGVLHRDIKLGNVLVGEGDEIMMIDFGLAKSTTDERLTRTGRSMGTYAYMAPEYVQAAMLGAAQHTVLTDLWATGCVLYALAAQKSAFNHDDDLQLLRTIQSGSYVPVDQVRTDISDELAAVIHDLMQPDPDKRIQTAEELASRLRVVSTTTDPSKPAFVPPSRTSLPNAKTVASPKRKPPPTEKEASTSSFSMGPYVNAPPDTERQPSMPGLTEVSRLQPPTETDSQSRSSRRQSASSEQRREPSKAPARQPSVDKGDDLSVFSAALANDGRRTNPASPAAFKTAPDTLVEESPLLTEERADEAVEPATPAVAELPRPSFRAAVGADTTSKKNAIRNLVLPLVGAAAVIVVGGAAIQLTSRTTSTNAAFVDPDSVHRARDARSELEALERAKKEQEAAAAAKPASPPTGPTPAPAAATAAAVAQGDAEPVDDAVDDAPTPSERPARRASTRREPAAASDPWAERYGSRTDFNQSAVAARDAPAAAATTAATAGVRVPVRLENALASSPTGPVIAIVTSATRVGDVELPSGTQVHGESSGTSGSRILVNFTFAVVGGRNVTLRGTAMGTDGRKGIPAVKSLGGISDVGAGAVSGAVQAAGEGLADVVGDNPAGAAVRGATSPSAQKGGKLNNEEDLVTAKRGTRFAVYVDEK